MIQVTRFNKSKFFVNAVMIEVIEETPDTVLTLVSGKKIVVADSAAEVLEQIEQYYRAIGLVGSMLPRRVEG
ncbi:MAG: hypothetical protein JWN30_1539 [Bacilli bacterium]|nr:hypothetical protein [Bacilli bacterium]